MRTEEVQLVLAKCAAFDNRAANPATVLAWTDALDRDVTVDEAIAAVTTHYASSRDWIMPSDVNRIVRAARSKRVTDEQQRHGYLIPEGLGDRPELEVEWRRSALAALGRGATREQASDYAWRTIGLTPPPQLPTAKRAVRVEQIGERA